MYETQLEWIRWLQEWRGPWVDEFFRFLNYFDRWEFYGVVVPLVWVGFHWRAGLRLFYFLMINGIVNGVLKGWFMLPRPCALDPALGMVNVSGWGFPSGAAQTVILVSGMLLSVWRGRWAWVVCANYVFWVSLSRVFLGVHVPTDVLGGWCVGGLLLLVYLYVRPWVEKKIERWSALGLFVLSQVVPWGILVMLKWPVRFCVLAASLGIGLGLGYGWKWLLEVPKDRWRFGLRAGIGIVGVFVLDVLAKQCGYGGSLQSAIMGIWISLFASGVVRILRIS